MRVELGREALNDLEQIEFYLVSQMGMSKRILDYLDFLISKIEVISKNPEIGVLFGYTLDDQKIYKKVIDSNYSFFYIIEAERLLILRVWHNSRNPSSLELQI